MAKLLSRFGSKKDLASQQQEYQCAIRLLDDEEILQTTFQKDHKGQHLLDFVFKKLNLYEKDYFGLRFVDQNNLRIWLDPTRNILKQIKHLNPIIFCFRIKYYPANPTLLKDEITRYYLYLQLRRDILNRRLYCLPIDAIFLMACVVQSELGDYNEQEHRDNYISTMKIVPNQNEKLELEAIEIHKTQMLKLTPADAELKFLERASKLETYGIDPYPVKDQKKLQYLIGINYSGILCFQGNKKMFHFKWNDLQKITYEGKMFILHEYSAGKKNLVGFKCPNVSACQNLWRMAIEQRYFFTMNSSTEIPLITTGGGLFSKQCKLRYSGRVEREILDDMKKSSANNGNQLSPGNHSSSINRRHSMNTMPSSIRSFGRSNTAPLPDDGSPTTNKKIQASFYDDKNPYMNYSIVSEPEQSTKDGPTTTTAKIAQSNCSMIIESIADDNNNESIHHQQQQQTQRSTITNAPPCLPTEFDMRPDITPTGDEQQTNMISFETPVVRSSPSQLSAGGATTSTAAAAATTATTVTIINQHKHPKHSSSETTETTNDSDETLEQISEIVDQTPSTYQKCHNYQQHQQQQQQSNSNNINNNNINDDKYHHQHQQQMLNKQNNRSPMIIMAKNMKYYGKKLSIIMFTSIISALIIAMLITGLLILILESDSKIFTDLKQLPEMIIFQNDYYEPTKEWLWKLWKSIETDLYHRFYH